VSGDSTGSAPSRPALVAIALALGCLLDDKSSRPHHPSAAHRLTEVVGLLHKGTGRRGRLAAVRTMTRPSGPLGG